jgi:hypothetical protein
LSWNCILIQDREEPGTTVAAANPFHEPTERPRASAASRSRAAEGVKFIGIGAARCATSWIANVLRAHPEICLSEPKEVRYFNRYLLPIGDEKGRRNPQFDRDLDWYLKRFAHARPGQIAGEWSPVYMSDAAAPAAIAQDLPEVKLIACLRNPVDRAYSAYWNHRATNLIGDIDFETALEQEPVYVTMGYYAAQLRRYLKHFPREHMLVMVFDDMTARPEVEFTKLFTFLGVSAQAEIDFRGQATNEAAQLKSQRLKSIAYKLSTRLIDAGFSPLVDRLRRARLAALLTAVNSTPVAKLPMRPETRARLTATFADDVAELESLLGRRLDHWHAAE